MPTPAEQLFSETYGRTLRTWGTVATFRQTVQLGLPTATDARTQGVRSLYDALVSDPQYKDLITNREAFLAAMPKDKFVELSVHRVLETSVNSLDAATILFAHSMIDGAAFDYCRVTALHAPEDWESDFSTKQVPLSVVRKMPFEEIRDAKLREALRALERESLREKIDRLHARCRPPNGWSPMNGYVFDLGRIEGLDRLRQEIVHGKALGQPIPNVDDEFDYMNRTCLYFMGLVNLKYNLKIDPQLAFCGR